MTDKERELLAKGYRRDTGGALVPIATPDPVTTPRYRDPGHRQIAEAQAEAERENERAIRARAAQPSRTRFALAQAAWAEEDARGRERAAYELACERAREKERLRPVLLELLPELLAELGLAAVAQAPGPDVGAEQAAEPEQVVPVDLPMAEVMDDEPALPGACEDDLAEFVRTCCVVGEGHEVRNAALFGGWVAWCAERGKDPWSAPTFFYRLRTRVPGLGRRQPQENGGERPRFTTGIGLAPNGGEGLTGV